MKILVDTNILISALLFPHSKPAKALLYVSAHHELILCDRNISELYDVLKRKAPDTLKDAEILLTGLSFKLIPAIHHTEKIIRDTKDQPILNAAIAADIDIILTGDKDFLSLDIDHPRCINAAQFLDEMNI